LWFLGALGACGGGTSPHLGGDASFDGVSIDAALDALPDGPVDAPDAMLDAAPDAPPPCSADPAGYGNVSRGTTTNRASGNWFDTQQPNSFHVGVVLAMNANGSRDAYILSVARPSGGYALGVAYANNGDATATQAVAYAAIFGDYDSNGNYGNYYWATTGETTFTAFGETTGSAIDGSTTAMTFGEIDDQGFPIVGGCTTSIDSVQFHLVQN
jgi:hypothetical protein